MSQESIGNRQTTNNNASDFEYLKSLTLLYVEDDEEIRWQFNHFLTRYTGTLITANNGMEGIEAYCKHRPDIILTDINMPVMDGLAMSRAIRELDTSVPIIVLSAFDQRDYLMEAINIGIDKYVVKPVISSKLSDALLACAHRLWAEAEIKQAQALLEDRINEEVRKSRKKDSLMLQQEKLASIGQLAAGVAHEINNPIGFITSNLQRFKEYADSIIAYHQAADKIIAEECPAPLRQRLAEYGEQHELSYILGDIQELIEQSLDGAQRVKQIVLDLKDFAHPDENGIKEASLNKCIESTVNMVRNEIKFVADLILDLGELVPILCNPQQINQVITNLLLNAAHSISERGTISVTTRMEGGHALLTISDTGCGIPPEILSRIFDPFFTTKEVGKGTGLGLAISSDIIQKHNGVITVTSEPGKGSTFTVTLPVG